VCYYLDESKIKGTIFQVCERHKKYIPCFCYHESLSIAGNRRMCLVEVSNSLKLVASCAKPMEKEIKILLSSKRVERAREAVLEFLLINHPLDCPICDQGGECDLQDISLVFGSDRGRYYERIKRAVYDRECGSLIKMVLTRCIHCTRCVRFLSEIGDERELGMLGRGELSEIGTFLRKAIVSEMSGNIIDLCPVGALTSRPYAFTARPWELNMVESIDLLDSSLSSIRIEYLNNKIYRILPVYSKSVNKD
jgi:NADH dehydrogenase/NADH:ubiquinone oxidoreductase subunit G